ncbi:hydroxymethylglutaryl-CoA synthase [Chloroflexota bacterium]
MAGIVSYGGYIPLYRLSRELIGKAWMTTAGLGERSVANWDEDSLTMGVEACTDCLNGRERQAIGGLYFASTTPPYREKQTASIVAAASNLPREIFTADFTDSIRAGTSAMQVAIDTVKAGSAKEVLVVASDCRTAAPNSEFEPLFGDGAAAFLIGDSEVAVNIEGSYTFSSEFMDVWRLEGERFHRTWEDRFVQAEGYVAHVREAVSALFKKYGVTPKDFTKLVLYAPNARRHNEVVRNLGFDAKTQVQEPLFNTVGHTGAAFAPMMLVAALEEAKPGDRILYVNYGDGVDAYILGVTEQIENIRNRRGIKHHLASKSMLPTYEKYVRFRNLMEWEAERRPPDISSLPVLWRERNQILRLHGHKCRQCGTIQYPIQRVCTWCQTKDDFEEVRLSDKQGTIFTFSMDERAMVPELPNVICIVDLEGGGRFYTRVTDRDPGKIEVGMKVELTIRNMHDGSGLHNYFWLARPIRS